MNILAYAGGYVVPILPSAPVALPAGGDNLWMTAIPVALMLLIKAGSRDQMVTRPGGHGGPCFHESTQIMTPHGWQYIDRLAAGDIVMTHLGPQEVLYVGCWTPVEHKDRPYEFQGVKLTHNHHLNYSGKRVPAELVGEVEPNDGASFYHILTEHHAWLWAKVEGGNFISAESMLLTKDHGVLANNLPDVVANHAAKPCGEIW